MKYLKIIILTVTAIISFSGLYAQFSLQGELRPRFEFRDGYKYLRTDTTKPAILISQRTRLFFNYQSKTFSSKVTLQDIRTWGEEKFKADIASDAIHEAWVNVRLIDSLSLKIGIQELVYDNERILSNNNWQQAGTSHDAAVFKYKRSGWTIDACVSFNQQSDSNIFGTDYSRADIRSNYKTLDFIWLEKRIKKLDLQAVFLADGYQKYIGDKSTYFRYTYGPVISYSLKNFGIVLRGFNQTGDMPTGTNQDGKEVNAYFANADLSCTVFKKLNIVAGFEWWSGYNFTDSTSRQINSFDVLYGTGHKFNGNMDYFTKPGDTKNAGLLDAYLFITYKFNNKISSRLDYHYFALSNNYGKKNGDALDKYLGSELDLSVKMDFTKEVSFNFGYSVMFATTTMETIRADKKNKISGGDHTLLPSWGFIMLTVKPEFFKI